MTNRVTIEDVEAKARRLAAVLDVPYGHYQSVAEIPDDYPAEGYRHQMSDGSYLVTIEGSLEISQAYGGVSLHAISATGSTAVTDVFRSGHVSKRELAGMIDAALAVSR